MGRKHKKNHKRTIGGGGGLVPHVSRKIHCFFLHIKKMNVDLTVPRSPFFWEQCKSKH